MTDVSRGTNRPSFEMLMKAQEVLSEARDLESKAGHKGAAMVLNDLTLSLFQIALSDEFDALADAACEIRYPGSVAT
jgi:hypothetical protein